MLFNSYVFIFLFMPIVGLIYYYLVQRYSFLATAWLMAASIFFYAWWSVAYLWLLFSSIIFNYTMGICIDKYNTKGKNSRPILIFAIAINLALLAYYKYANFFLDSAGTTYRIKDLILPMGISFFTFTQIAFLVDVFKKKASEYHFIHYTLFVTYFPHLIAGPILHHSEMMPQFREKTRFTPENISVGLMIFVIGLFKKVIIADNVCGYADPVFHAAHEANSLTFFAAWAGALAYSFQLYFDFSGYSDMAVGISRMLGIKLPINFYSPYQSNNIIDFWRRWHITLSRFLRDYLYFPLGGNRKGKWRRYANLMTTMVLGGLWHGASWNFVIWGFLHGFYLIINHAWVAIRSLIFPSKTNHVIERALARMLTFMVVVIAWVFFRADTFGSAINVLKAMAGQNGIVIPQHWNSIFSIPSFMSSVVSFGDIGTTYQSHEFFWLGLLLLVVWFLPNTYQIMKHYQPSFSIKEEFSAAKLFRFLEWKPNLWWAMVKTILIILAVFSISRETVFLYYQF